MSNDDTLKTFFEIFNDDASTKHHDARQLMSAVFCADNARHKLPCVGVTDHGPQYVGAADVAELFQKLFTTFPEITLEPLRHAPYLYSKDKKTIAVQASLKGRHHADWFPPGHKFYSPPLSNIHPDKVHIMDIPACAVFTFDDSERVARLAIYLDRYRMQQQLTTGAPAHAGVGATAGAAATAGSGKRITITIE
jgi:hypothetical protein